MRVYILATLEERKGEVSEEFMGWRAFRTWSTKEAKGCTGRDTYSYCTFF